MMTCIGLTTSRSTEIGITCKFVLAGGNVARHMNLHFCIDSSKPFPDREPAVEFYMGSVGKTKEGVKAMKVYDKVVTKIKLEKNRDGQDMETEKGYIEITLKYGTIVVHGIDRPQAHWNTQTLRTLEHLATFPSKKLISIRIVHEHGSQELEEMLNLAKKHSDPAWAPYLSSTSQTVLSQVGSFRPRKELTEYIFRNGEKYQLLPIPAKNYFATPREAQVKLCYGDYVEFEYAKDAYATISYDSHDVAFTITPKGFVLASVFLSIPEAEIPAEERVELTIEFFPDNAEHAVACQGNQTENLLNLPGDLELLVNKRPTTMKEYASALHTAPRKFTCTIKAHINESQHRDAMVAVTDLREEIK